MAATLVQSGGEKTVAERLEPTLEAAERELRSARRTGACLLFMYSGRSCAELTWGTVQRRYRDGH